jgi:hypothetical protein
VVGKKIRRLQGHVGSTPARGTSGTAFVAYLARLQLAPAFCGTRKFA